MIIARTLMSVLIVLFTSSCTIHRLHTPPDNTPPIHVVTEVNINGVPAATIVTRENNATPTITVTEVPKAAPVIKKVGCDPFVLPLYAPPPTMTAKEFLKKSNPAIHETIVDAFTNHIRELKEYQELYKKRIDEAVKNHLKTCKT